MTTSIQAQAGPSLPTTQEDVHVNGHPPIPILLLKTLSKPDAYLSYFTTSPPSSSSFHRFSPTFIPVLKHSFVSSALGSLRTNLSTLPSTYSGLIFTSQRAVEAFSEVVQTSVHDDQEGKNKEGTRKQLKEFKIPFYTVGPATSRALEGIRDAYFPRCIVEGQETGNGAGLAEYILKNHRGQPLPQVPQEKKTSISAVKDNDESNTTTTYPSPSPSQRSLPLLFLVGEQRRDIIPKTLMSPLLPTTQRILVEEIVVYETSVMQSFAADFRSVLDQHKEAEIIWVVVFSPTGCEAMLRTLGWLDPGSRKVVTRNEGEGEGEGKGEGEAQGGNKTRRKIFIATIGPTTRDYLKQEFGCEVDVCAERPSPEGVREGVEGWMRERGLV